MDEKAVTERDGDLYIEGWAADVGLDDQDEYFTGEALKAAAAEFMSSGNTPLLFHHKADMQLGEVTLLEPREREPGHWGLWMKARVEKPSDSHPILADAYRKIARGTMKGLSVAGRFFGERTPQGMRLARAKFREISVTPFPVNSATLASVAAKAFPADEDCGCNDVEAAEQALTGAKALVESLSDLWDAIRGKAAPTAEQRKQYGMSPDGAFPIWHCGSGPGSVKSALHLAGHSKNHSRDSVMAHIRSRAKALGCPIKDTDSHKD